MEVNLFLLLLHPSETKAVEIKTQKVFANTSFKDILKINNSDAIIEIIS